jgi:hypothetical protein
MRKMGREKTWSIPLIVVRKTRTTKAPRKAAGAKYFPGKGRVRG